MTDLLDTLYTYTRENLLTRHLAGTGFRAQCRALEEREDALRERLAGEDLGRLEELLELSADVQDAEQRALFRAALSLGLAIARF